MAAEERHPAEIGEIGVLDDTTCPFSNGWRDRIMRYENIAIVGRTCMGPSSMAGLERSPTASSVVGYQLARYPAAMTQNTSITRTVTAPGRTSVPKAALRACRPGAACAAAALA